MVSFIIAAAVVVIVALKVLASVLLKNVRQAKVKGGRAH